MKRRIDLETQLKKANEQLKRYADALQKERAEHAEHVLRLEAAERAQFDKALDLAKRVDGESAGVNQLAARTDLRRVTLPDGTVYEFDGER